MQQATAATAPMKQQVPDVVPGRVLHLDGDMLCYWAGGGDDTAVGIARTVALQKIKKLQELSASESTVVHLTADGSSKGDRRIISTTKPYQGQRKGARPVNWQYLRDFFSGYEGEAFRVKVWSTREADDGVALCAATSTSPIAIATRDKDFRMIPGIHIDWIDHGLTELRPGEWCVISNDVVFGLKWFWLQMLQGDTADNIPGVGRVAGKPVGPKTAEKFLLGADRTQAEAIVTKLYQQEHGDKWVCRFTEQAMLLWMRTDMAGSPGDFMSTITDPATIKAVRPEVAAVNQRIKDAYAEAEGFRNSGVSQ